MGFAESTELPGAETPTLHPSDFDDATSGPSPQVAETTYVIHFRPTFASGSCRDSVLTLTRPGEPMCVGCRRLHCGAERDITGSRPIRAAVLDGHHGFPAANVFCDVARPPMTFS
ncbi:MAG: hypothetical protein ABSH51_00430 [Solirubrobacteraceae bacterium]|jgi:hypothetical protein